MSVHSDPLFFRLLVPTVDDIRPSTPIPSTMLPPRPSAEDECASDANYIRWCHARAEASQDAYELAADTRDNGTLYHGRTVDEDLEPFNPYTVARAECYPGAAVLATLPPASWLAPKGGAA